MLTVVVLLLLVASAVCAGLVCFACVLSGRIDDSALPSSYDSRSDAILIDARIGGEIASS